MFGVPNPVHAPVGEAYTLSASPGRIQESYAPGVSLILAVSNASTSKTYSFTWHVLDPSGATYTNTNSMTTGAAQTSFMINVLFPRNFTLGATTKYVGNYYVSVDQNTPTPARLGVASAKFVVGLTDALSYQRTAPVSIRAEGYKPLDTVTVSFFNSTGFAYSSYLVYADSTGNVTTVWTIPPSAPLGNTTVLLQGASGGSRKAVPDSQSFIVYPTNVTIAQLQVAPNILQRTQLAKISFNPSYQNGMSVQTGSGSVELTEADGTTKHLITASYNSTIGEFTAYYLIPIGSRNGSWVATLAVDSFLDGYGNGGPLANVVRGFTVQTASLTISVSIANSVYGPGDLVPIYATVRAQDGSVISSGTVTAIMTNSGRQQGNRVSLTFDPSQGKWVGTYNVPSTGSSGVWYAQVQATDAYGNLGQGSTTAVISISLGGSFLFSFWFLAIATGLAVALVAGILIWRRKNIFRAVLKVDLEAISKEAKKVESQDFFRNIQDQLKRERETEEKKDG
jgi:hypothetical protein